MTNQQIAEKSNVPESTVARIFSGKTPNPTIATVVSMARAMGGSAADFFNEEEGEGTVEAPDTETDENGFDSEEDERPVAPRRDRRGAYYVQEPPPMYLDGAPTLSKYYEDMVNFYKSAVKQKERWIVRLFICLAVMMAFVLFILVFDILNPGFGFVKY